MSSGRASSSPSSSSTVSGMVISSVSAALITPSDRASGRTSSVIRASRPFTNRPESFVEYCFASSTASVIDDARSASRGSSRARRCRCRSSARSITGMRSSAQCSEYFRMNASISSRCSSTPAARGGARIHPGRPAARRGAAPRQPRCSHSSPAPAHVRAARRVGTPSPSLGPAPARRRFGYARGASLSLSCSGS